MATFGDVQGALLDAVTSGSIRNAPAEKALQQLTAQKKLGTQIRKDLGWEEEKKLNTLDPFYKLSPEAETLLEELKKTLE